MNDELLYCKPWKHMIKKLHNKQVEICVSDAVNGNQQGTVIQYHAVIIIKNEIARLCDFSNNITQAMAEKYVNDFENNIRNIVRKNLQWRKNKPDNNTVKIWYYSKNENNPTEINDKRYYPYFRLAITVNNVSNINQEDSKMITNQLKDYMFDWVEKIISI